MKIDFHQEVSRLRAKGWRMFWAWRAAKLSAPFYALEKARLVRLDIVPDEGYYDDSYIDESYPLHERAKERKELWARIEREGVWGIVGEYRVSVGDPWLTADSLWGFIGDDWKDDADIDIHVSAVEARNNLIQEIADRMADRPTYASL